jgi:hypothetical protein
MILILTYEVPISVLNYNFFLSVKSYVFRYFVGIYSKITQFYVSIALIS